jgi:MerR family transcriptional regulator, mercuric resistance operon regulatory protein
MTTPQAHRSLRPLPLAFGPDRAKHFWTDRLAQKNPQRLARCAYICRSSFKQLCVLPVVTTGARRSAMSPITSARAEKLTIGELSGLTAVNIETIRYYERIKVLPAPPRTSGGRRVYDATHLRVLAFIRRSRELGFSIDEIRALIRLGGPAKASCRQVRDIASHHLNDIRAKIADLRRLERLLATTVARCTGTTAPDCPVLEILDVRRSW